MINASESLAGGGAQGTRPLPLSAMLRRSTTNPAGGNWKESIRLVDKKCSNWTLSTHFHRHFNPTKLLILKDLDEKWRSGTWIATLSEPTAPTQTASIIGRKIERQATLTQYVQC